VTRFRLPDLPEKRSPRRCGRGLEHYGLIIQTAKNRGGAYCVVVAFGAFVFFVFVALVFFVFVVSWPAGAPVANTGIASENATAKVNSNVKSFFILGLDLLKNYFLFSSSKPWAISLRLHQILPSN